MKEAPGSGSRPRRGTLVVVVVVVLIAAAVATLVMLGRTNSAEGAAALNVVKDRTGPALARQGERARALGESLDVSWTTTPMPGDRSHTVVARIESRPSGAVRNASFMVMADGSVMAMDETAQRLIRGAAGETRTMTMEDGSQMQMP